MAAFLRARGYRVEEQRFSFQPASLNALPIFGAGVGWLALLLLPLLLWPGAPRGGAVAIALTGLGALGVLAWGIGSGVEVPGAERREDVNLIATRPGGQVRRWVVAHLDSKAQGHSMAGRLVAVWLLLLATVGLLLLAALRALGGGPVPMPAAVLGAGLTLAAGALASRGRLRGGSPGARDNASGLLAALVAAETAVDPAVGILVTGAEEFGLVGARAFVRAGAAVRGSEVLNLDTLADRGALYVVTHDAQGEELARRMAVVLEGIGPRVAIRRLPLGILTDSLPLARAGARAVTISRLDWSVLRLIHTTADLPVGLDPATAELAGRAVGTLPVGIDQPPAGA